MSDKNDASGNSNITNNLSDLNSIPRTNNHVNKKSMKSNAMVALKSKSFLAE